MTTTCPSCDQPAPKDSTICKRCTSDTRKRLGDQSALFGELTTTMTRQSRMAAQSDGGRSANTPVAFHEAAATALHEQRHVLVGWAKLCHDEIDQQWPRRDTIHAIALHIESRLGDLRKHPAAGEMVDEIREMTLAGWEATDYPEDRQRSDLGPCVMQVEGGDCLGRMTLHIPHSKPVYADCPECRTQWDSSQLNRLGQRIIERDEAVA